MRKLWAVPIAAVVVLALVVVAINLMPSILQGSCIGRGAVPCIPDMSTVRLTGYHPHTLAVTPSDTFNLGQTVSETLTVETTYVADEDASDGSVTYLYGKWAIAKEGTIIDEGTWESITSGSTFTHSFAETLDTAGTYAYATVMYVITSTYNPTTQTWSPYQIVDEPKAEYVFRMQVPVPTQNPLQFLADLWTSFVNWLMSLFGV